MKAIHKTLISLSLMLVTGSVVARSLKHHLTKPCKDGLTLVEWSIMRYKKLKTKLISSMLATSKEKSKKPKMSENFVKKNSLILSAIITLLFSVSAQAAEQCPPIPEIEAPNLSEKEQNFLCRRADKNDFSRVVDGIQRLKKKNPKYNKYSDAAFLLNVFCRNGVFEGHFLHYGTIRDNDEIVRHTARLFGLQLFKPMKRKVDGKTMTHLQWVDSNYDETKNGKFELYAAIIEQTRYDAISCEAAGIDPNKNRPACVAYLERCEKQYEKLSVIK